jgi:hypothetical protein
MGVDFMRPAINLEPKYRVTMLTREDWTKATVAPPVVKGLVWFTDGSKTMEVTGAGVYGQSVGRRSSFSLGRYTRDFQAGIYVILACVCEIRFQNRPEKYFSICSDSQAALKALRAVRTAYVLVQQCQKALNNISTRHAVGLFGSPNMLVYEEMRSPMSSLGVALFWGFSEMSRLWESLDEVYREGSVAG